MKTSKEALIKTLKGSSCNKIKLAIVDIDGVLRGKVVSLDKFISILDGGLGFCAVVFGWDMEDKSYDNVSVTGWHTGYPDFQAHVDLATQRSIPWEKDLPFFLADFEQDTAHGAKVCPRSLLKRVRQRAWDAGFMPQFSQEFEWFNFEVTPDGFGNDKPEGAKPMTPGMFGYSILRASLKSEFFNDLFDLCHKFGIPLEGLHTETGPGVYEAAIQYSEILLAADRAVLFKTSVKEIAYKHGLMATFMAKWSEALPGNGGHVHQSLWDSKQENNLFYDGGQKWQMSRIMRQYIAGQLHCLPYILPMFAPTINSYKRLVEGAWAPTTLTWARDNRTTALRVLPGGEKSTRLETRVIGSDVNPYLAMAACLAAGLYGIEQQMELSSAATLGNGYEDYSNGSIPTSLREATRLMKDSDLANILFGEDFVQHFCKTRDWECREFESSITDWERKRYFEII